MGGAGWAGAGSAAVRAWFMAAELPWSLFPSLESSRRKSLVRWFLLTLCQSCLGSRLAPLLDGEWEHWDGKGTRHGCCHHLQVTGTWGPLVQHPWLVPRTMGKTSAPCPCSNPLVLMHFELVHTILPQAPHFLLYLSPDRTLGVLS